MWLFYCSSVFVFNPSFRFAERCHSKIVAGNRNWTVIVPSHTNNTAISTLIARSSGLFLTVFVWNQMTASSSIFSNCSLPQALISLTDRSHNNWWHAKKLSKETKCCLPPLTGLSMVDTTCGPNGMVLWESFPQWAYISRICRKPWTLHSIHILYPNCTGFPFKNCLALWRPRYGTTGSSTLRFSWNTPNCWQLVFSFSSNGNTFANLEEVNFDCHVDEVGLFGSQKIDDSTTATQVHQWNPPPAQWAPPPHTHKPWFIH